MPTPTYHSRRVLFFLFLGIAVMIAIADRTPIHLEKRFPQAQLREDIPFYLDGVVNRTLPGPYIYRVFIPYTVRLIMGIFPVSDPLTIDFILKILILICCEWYFYKYMLIFFSPFESVGGVIILDLYIAVSLATIQGPSLIETADLFNMLIYILAFIALYANRFFIFSAILFIGMINRETPLLILPFFVFREVKMKQPMWRSVVVLCALVIPYVAVRAFVGTNAQDWLTTEGLSRNLPFFNNDELIHVIVGNAHVLFLLGPLLVISMFKFHDHPQFLRMTGYFVPLFIIVHYIFGAIVEARLWMPLYVILVPLTIDTLRRKFGEIPQ